MAGRRNDPNEFAEQRNASVQTTENAGEPPALADPPVAGDTDPRVSARTEGRDQRAATAPAGEPAPEPTDEQVADPDAPDEAAPKEIKCRPWRSLNVPAQSEGEQDLTIHDEWTRVEAADVDRVVKTARRSRTELRVRDPQTTDA